MSSQISFTITFHQVISLEDTIACCNFIMQLYETIVRYKSIKMILNNNLMNCCFKIHSHFSINRVFLERHLLLKIKLELGKTCKLTFIFYLHPYHKSKDAAACKIC